MKSHIIINQKTDEIVLKINENSPHEKIIEELKEKLEKLKNLYKEEKMPIYVVGKVLKNKEIDEIQEIITKIIDVEVKFDSPKVLGLYEIKKTFEKDLEISETKYYKGDIRSGQKIEFEGSIVIIGNVNGGAEVVAGENISIIGDLRGLAHAGAKGNKKAIISALMIDAPQIRIANIVKEIEKSEENIIKKAYVYVENEEIKMNKI